MGRVGEMGNIINIVLKIIFKNNNLISFIINEFFFYLFICWGLLVYLRLIFVVIYKIIYFMNIWECFWIFVIYLNNIKYIVFLVYGFENLD